VTKAVLASANRHKLEELRAALPDWEIEPLAAAAWESHFRKRGDAAAAVNLDAARLELLKSASGTGRTTPVNHRELLQEIADLNAKAIGCLEHHHRRTARDMDMASAGRRALIAYSPTRLQL